MKVEYIFRSRDPDERDEADLVCPECGYKDIYVFGWTEPYEAADAYCKGYKCPKCGHIDN